jgi:hemerythrin-like domain-containing protein
MPEQKSSIQNGDTASLSATKLLAEDHDTVRQMQTQYETPDLGSTEKRDLAHEVFLALEIHASIEEKVFYPAVAKALGREGQRLVAEAIEEHRQVKNAIAALRTLALGDAAFDARFLATLADVEHHASEEEREMFPRAEEALGDETLALGSRITMLKNTLLRAKVQAGAA